MASKPRHNSSCTCGPLCPVRFNLLKLEQVARKLVDNVGRALANRKQPAASSKVYIGDFTVWIFTNHRFDFWANKRWNKIALSTDEIFSDIDGEAFSVVFPNLPVRQLVEVVVVYGALSLRSVDESCHLQWHKCGLQKGLWPQKVTSEEDRGISSFSLTLSSSRRLSSDACSRLSSQRGTWPSAELGQDTPRHLCKPQEK